MRVKCTSLKSVRPSSSDILSTTIVVDRFRPVSIDWGRVLSSFFPIGWKERIEIILLVHGKLMTKIKDTHRFRRTDCIYQHNDYTRLRRVVRRLSRGNSGHPKFPRHQLFLGSRTGQTHSIKIGAIQVLKTRIYRCWSRSKACVPEIMGVLNCLALNCPMGVLNCLLNCPPGTAADAQTIAGSTRSLPIE